MLDIKQPYVPFLDVFNSPRFEDLSQPIYSNPATGVTIYKATYYADKDAPRPGISVALKVWPRDARDPSEEAAYRDTRIRREIAALRGIQHPNIVRICDAASAGDHYYIATEWFEATLARRLADAMSDRRLRLSLRSTLAKMYQIACGLSTMHAAGFFHRDIKPENIFLDMIPHDGHPQRAVLSDLGIAFQRSWRHITGIYSVVGTVTHISPEILVGQEFTCQSDLFSLGVVFFECLTGTVPWPNPGASGVNRLRNGVHLPAPDIRIATFIPDLPDNVVNIVNSLLSIDPHDRPASAYVLALQLLAADRALPRSTSGSSPLKQISLTSINRRMPNAWEEDRACLRCGGTGWISSDGIDPNNHHWGCFSCGGEHTEQGRGYIRGTSLSAFAANERWSRIIWLQIAIIIALSFLASILALIHFHH
jgi:serine/threonine protein kinase